MVDLRTAREARGYTQEALARVLGVSVSTVRRWESGTAPRKRMRERLARLLGVEADDLGFGGRVS